MEDNKQEAGYFFNEQSGEFYKLVDNAKTFSVMPKNESALTVMQSVYAAHNQLEGLGKLVMDETQDACKVILDVGNKVNPYAQMTFISGRRLYVCDVFLAEKKIKVTSVKSGIEQIVANAHDPTKVKPKQKGPSRKLIAAQEEGDEQYQ